MATCEFLLMTEPTTGHQGQWFRKCFCGWSEVTSQGSRPLLTQAKGFRRSPGSRRDEDESCELSLTLISRSKLHVVVVVVIDNDDDEVGLKREVGESAVFFFFFFYCLV